MKLSARIEGFAKVGDFLERHYAKTPVSSENILHEGLEDVIRIAETYNNWFIPKFVHEAIQNLRGFLVRSQLESFSTELSASPGKTIALICAGNIPLVCFHDVLCVLLSGNKALIKLSADDKILLPFFLKLLCHFEPEFEALIFFADGKISNFDAVIATGSDNTASHLHYYFGKYPNIIRKNRSSLAVITGSESTEDLKNLASDVFQYFGLGCRNVNKLMVPAGYSFNTFFESIIDWSFVVNNKKYGNNYDYHRAIFLLEQIPFLDNNFLMIREEKALHSPVGVLHYEYYNSAVELDALLKSEENQLQCIVGKDYTPFGYSQKPVISDFADNVNTLKFLLNL